MWLTGKAVLWGLVSVTGSVLLGFLVYQVVSIRGRVVHLEERLAVKDEQVTALVELSEKSAQTVDRVSSNQKEIVGVLKNIYRDWGYPVRSEE